MGRVLLLSFIFFVAISTGCNHLPKNKGMIKKEIFGTHKGKEVYLFTLTNKAGNNIKLTNYGARITWIEVPDKNGNKDNITFGYDSFKSTVTGDFSFGTVMGRYAHRIAKGKFNMDGIEYNLPLNSGRNSFSGGLAGWHSVVWDAEVIKDSEFPAIKFAYLSPDMEAGLPGSMKVEVIYTWTDKNEIVIAYSCSTDKKSVINLTNHAYFNLHGAGNGDILDHLLTIKAAAFTPVDSFMIPTGEIRKVEGTPLDFNDPHTIGERINESYEQLIIGRGYDCNYVLDNNEEVDVTVYEPVSGRMLELITDQPGLQLYTGNYLNESKIGHSGKIYNFRSGFCLESGHFPDSPNHPEFPTTIINPDEIFKSTTIYRFSVKSL
jgi:aldose 1-epimerase